MKSKESWKHLENRLEALEIIVSEGRDGLFTAFTEEEPLFCFVRKDISQLNTLVEDTLRSYVRNFFDCESIEVRSESVPFEEPAVPIEHLTPVSRIRPTFSAPEKGPAIKEFA